MKNLKKVLALVMAFAMAFTMMAGAAFTDQADIKATEAVDMLTALNIINGNPDGSFNPEGTVTRAEMAKMIYVLRTGKDTADNFTSTPTTFTDINGHWAAGFIKYCQTMGIIAGESATKFNPDGIVTGTQAAKMLLVTIGYDQNKAGLVGSGWDTKTNALASENGLLDDVDSDLNSGLPRQYAAQLIYNAVDADTVSYDDAGNVQKTEKTENNIVEKETGEVTYQYGYKLALKADGGTEVVVTTVEPSYSSYAEAKDAATAAGGKNLVASADKVTKNEDYFVVKGDPIKVKTYVTQSETKNETVGEKYLSLKTSVGVLMASGNATLDNTNYSGSDNALKISIGDNDYDEGSKNSFTKVTTDYTSLLGARVKVLYKDTDKVYGVYATDDNYVNTTVKASAIDKVSGSANKIDVDGTKYTVSDNVVFYIDNVAKSLTVSEFVAQYTDSDFDVTVISNDEDEKIDSVRLVSKQFGKITSMSSSAIYWKEYNKGVGGAIQPKIDIDSDEPVVYDGMKKDDYVFVSNLTHVTGFKDAITFEKAEKVTGKATATKDNDLKLDDTWYSVKNAKTISGNNWKIGKSYDLYTFGGYAYLVEGSNGSTLDVLYVKTIGDAKSLDDGVEVKALLDDGTEKIINVKKLIKADGAVVGNSDLANLKKELGTAVKNQVVQYDEDDSDYTLKALGTSDVSGTGDNFIKDVDGNKTDYGMKYNAAYNKNAASIGGNDIANDAVVFVKYTSGNDTKYKVVNGKAFQSYSDTGANASGNNVALFDTSDKDYVKVAYVDYGKNNVSSGDDLYAVVKGSSTQKNEDGDNVTVYDLLTKDGLKEGVWSDAKDGFGKGDIITFTGSYDSEITNVQNVRDLKSSSVDAGYGAIKSFNEDTNRATFYTGYGVVAGDKSNLGNAYETNAKITGDTTVIAIDQDGTWTVSEGNTTPGEAVITDDNKGYKANAFALTKEDNEFDLLVFSVNNALEDGDGVVELRNSAKNYTITGTDYVAITGTSTKYAKVTANKSAAAENDTITLTAALTNENSGDTSAYAVPEHKAVTVTATVDGTEHKIEIAAGKSSGTATFTMPAKNVTVSATAAEANAEVAVEVTENASLATEYTLNGVAEQYMKAGDKVELVVKKTDGGNIAANTWALTLSTPSGKTVENVKIEAEAATVTFTYTVTAEDVATGTKLTFAATGFATV